MLAIGTTRNRTGRGYGAFNLVCKGYSTYWTNICVVMAVVNDQMFSQPTILTARRVGMTNVTDLERQ